MINYSLLWHTVDLIEVPLPTHSSGAIYMSALIYCVAGQERWITVMWFILPKFVQWFITYDIGKKMKHIETLMSVVPATIIYLSSYIELLCKSSICHPTPIVLVQIHKLTFIAMLWKKHVVMYASHLRQLFTLAYGIFTPKGPCHMSVLFKTKV